jgi:hypothetical protein
MLIHCQSIVAVQWCFAASALKWLMRIYLQRNKHLKSLTCCSRAERAGSAAAAGEHGKQELAASKSPGPGPQVKGEWILQTVFPAHGSQCLVAARCKTRLGLPRPSLLSPAPIGANPPFELGILSHLFLHCWPLRGGTIKSNMGPHVHSFHSSHNRHRPTRDCILTAAHPAPPHQGLHSYCCPPGTAPPWIAFLLLPTRHRPARDCTPYSCPPCTSQAVYSSVSASRKHKLCSPCAHTMEGHAIDTFRRTARSNGALHSAVDLWSHGAKQQETV